MRAVHSWLRELVPGLPDARACADALTDAGLKVESVELLGVGDSAIDGVLVGEVVSIEELTEFKKPIRFVEVRVSDDGPLRGIVCGATNFVVGRPGARGTAGCRAAGQLHDRGPRDVWTHLRRHDLLGARARLRR